MSSRKAVYAGSFDPLTRGHEWVIRQAVALFDEVIIVVAHNAAKQMLFSPQERVEMICASLSPMPDHVRVEIVADRFVVQWAEQHDAAWMIRGMRNTIDFEYEMQVLEVNRHLSDRVSTVYLPSSPHGVSVSSSTVKGMMGIAGWEKQLDRYVSPHVLYVLRRKHVERELRSRFVALWRRLGFSSNADGNAVFGRIFRAYCEPHRRYHTWQHLHEVLTHFDRVRHLCEFPDEAEFALWVHDMHYVIGATDNEARSIEEGHQLYIDGGGDHIHATYVRSLVEALAHQRMPENDDERCIVDCDLAILGQDRDRYAEYMEQIREEYASVPYKIFCTKRPEILRMFLKRDPLYHTAIMRSLYEAAARVNLQYEIAELEGRLQYLDQQ